LFFVGFHPDYDRSESSWLSSLGSMKSASCRYFPAYCERCHENHAVIAMTARAFVKQDPFVVWGTGKQIRNWTYVGDIVEGTIRAAEVIEDGTAVNLGTMERVRVSDAASEVLRYTGHKVKIELHPELPTGPLNRVADNELAKKLLSWEPKVRFVDGLHRLIEYMVLFAKGSGFVRQEKVASFPSTNMAGPRLARRFLTVETKNGALSVM